MRVSLIDLTVSLFLIAQLLGCHPKSEDSSLSGPSSKITESSDQVHLQSENAKVEEINLKHEGRIILDTTVKPLMGMPFGMVIKSDRFVIFDDLARILFEFKQTGSFVRTYDKGDDNRHYVQPWCQSSTVDSSDKLYITDAGRSVIHVYEQDGHYVTSVNKDTELGIILKTQVDNSGDMLLLTGEYGTAKIKKYNIENSKLQYSKTLSPESDLLWHFQGAIGFCYNRSSNQLYYSFPSDYKISVIEVDDGEILGKLGVRPEGYQSVNKTYSFNSITSPEQVHEIRNKSTIMFQGMHLVDNRYILVGYFTGPDALSVWYVYDTIDLTVVYKLSNNSTDELHGKLVETRGDKIYAYVSPNGKSNGDSDNGYIDIYSLNFERHGHD